MPVRHGAAYLPASIESLISQTLRDFELLLIDDRADAACRQAMAAAAAGDPRVRIIAATGAGIADALNQGLDAARAPLVARMDADDVARPERLARQHATLIASPALAVLGSNYRVIDAAGTPGETVVLPATPAAIRLALRSSNPICHPAVMMRKQAALAVGGYRRALTGCEDFDLWLRLSERHEVANLQEPLLLYRRHAEQATWHRLEARLLAEVAVFRSAALRGQGRPDLSLSGDPVTVEMLRAGGVSGADLRRAIRARAFEAATHALNADERRHAASALAVARRHGALGTGDVLRYCRLMAKRVIARRATS